MHTFAARNNQNTTMSQSILTASTPIYALSDHTLISLKTYNWLLNIGVTTIEEMAMAFQVEGNTSLYNALPTALRIQIKELGTATLQKVQAKRIPLPTSTLAAIDQTHLQNLLNTRLKEMHNRYVRDWFQTKQPNFTQVLPLFGKTYTEYLYQYGTAVEANELYDLVQWFEMQYTAVLAHGSQPANPEDRTSRYTLTEEELGFVERYKAEHGHEPLWFMLYQLLQKSTKRNHEIFKLLHGLSGQAPKSTKELAATYNRTIALIQAINVECQEQLRQELLPNADWTPYAALLQRPFLTPEDPLIQQIVHQELPNQSPSQLLPLLLTTGIFKKSNFRTMQILINPQKLPNSEISSAMRWIKYKISLQSQKKRAVPEGIIQFEETILKNPNIKELMHYMLSKELQQELTSEEFEQWITMRPKPLAYDKIYAIIKQHGKPMYCDEIKAAYNQQYPEDPVRSDTQLRNYIRSCDKFKPVGRRSLYGLREWDHIFFGTIADYAVHILEQTDQPLTLSEIWEKLQLAFPMTNKHSMTNLIKNDTTKRFIKYSKQRFGLKGKVYPASYRSYTGQYVKTFEEYLDELKDYIHKHHELPIHYTQTKGRSLYNWFLKYRKGRLHLTRQQTEQLKALLDELDHQG